MTPPPRSPPPIIRLPRSLPPLNIMTGIMATIGAKLAPILSLTKIDKLAALISKVYLEGKMSQHFGSLKPEDVVKVKGPIEKLIYSPNMKKHIGMIASGTGITPMLQVIEAILKNPDDNTQVSLLYANVSPNDILLQQKLDILAASYPNLKIFYTVDNPSKNWKGGTGYISKDMVLKGLPSPGDDTLIPVCGPLGMMEHISGGKAKDWLQGELTGILKKLDTYSKWFTNFDR